MTRMGGSGRGFGIRENQPAKIGYCKMPYMSMRHIRLASRLTAAFGDRMLSKSGDPTISNILAVFAAIKRMQKVKVRMQVVMA